MTLRFSAKTLWFSAVKVLTLRAAKKTQSNEEGFSPGNAALEGL